MYSDSMHAHRVTLLFSDTTHSRTLMQLCYLTANLDFITTTYVMAYLFMMPSFGTSRFVYKDYNYKKRDTPISEKSCKCRTSKNEALLARF